MRPSGSGSTPANMSHTIDSLNVPRTFVTRSSADLITYATIRRRLQSFSIPFLDLDVELFMRSYIEASSHEEQIQKELNHSLLSDDAPGKTQGIWQRHSKELRDTFDPQKAAKIYELLARNHTWQTPTLTVLRAMSYVDDSNFTSDPKSGICEGHGADKCRIL